MSPRLRRRSSSPARAADSVKLGLDDPLTGTYAELGRNEQIGCELAIEQINAKGGILGRQAELLVEDSTSPIPAPRSRRPQADRARQGQFLLGNVNSAMAIALGQVSNEAKVLHIVTGGHTDAVTGTDCHWNVFRVCNTTRMETNSVSKLLFDKFGKKWYFIRPTTPSAIRCSRASRRASRSSAAPKSALPDAARHDRLLGLPDQGPGRESGRHHLPTAGQDAVNSLKQAVQFGLDKKFHIAGAQQELEVLEGLPPEARIGTWVFEWYWNQPNVPHVKEFVDAIRKKAARCRPRATGSATPRLDLCARRQRAEDAGTGQARQGARGFQVAAEIALMPTKGVLSRGNNQLMPTYVGHTVEGARSPRTSSRST